MQERCQTIKSLNLDEFSTLEVKIDDLSVNKMTRVGFLTICDVRANYGG